MIDQLSGEGKVARLGRRNRREFCSGNIHFSNNCYVSPISNGFVRVGKGSEHLAAEPPEMLQVLRAMSG